MFPSAKELAAIASLSFECPKSNLRKISLGINFKFALTLIPTEAQWRACAFCGTHFGGVVD
jgi:hypothetical protein